MEASRQHAPSRRERRDDPIKENICPLQIVDMAAFIAELGWRRRSPLPEGFPRSPLQDITHALSPHNIWLDGIDLLLRLAHKKLNKGKSDEIWSVDEADEGSSWRELTSCTQLQLSRREVLVEKLKVADGDEVQIRASEEDGKVKTTLDLHVVRDNEVVGQASDILQHGSNQSIQALGNNKQAIKDGLRVVGGRLYKGVLKKEGGASRGDSKQKMKRVRLAHVQVSVKEMKCRRPHKPLGSTNKSRSNILKFR